MIARSNRFHGRAALMRLQRSGSLTRSGALALRYAPNPRLKSSYRLAVVVSRKVSKSAVVRNRIRRRLYERVRILFNSLPASEVQVLNQAQGLSQVQVVTQATPQTTPYDLILMAYDERLATIEPAELDAEVAKIMQKAGLTSANHR